jgi:hypothetical protein
MTSRLWTWEVARALLFCLSLLTAAFTIMGVLAVFSSVITGIVLVLIQLATAAIAFKMPLNRKDEARRKMQVAMSQYVILQSLKATSSDKNRVVNRMRELAPVARFDDEEIVEYLNSADVGERFAGLACVQWQWRNSEAYEVMHFRHNKKPRELPQPPENPSRRYFSKLLDVLCDSWDEFENYHATVAVWSMVDSLGQENMQELFRRVLDQSVGITCAETEWRDFKRYLNNKRNR